MMPKMLSLRTGSRR